MYKKFTPAFGLENRHFQTLYSSLFRRVPSLSIEVENFTQKDGDFVECYWHNKPQNSSNTPIVTLFHGLAGSYDSPYIRGAMEELGKNGFAAVLMHFRGCSGKENRLPRSYHSGDSGDAHFWFEELSKRFPNSKLFGVGYSLGGNMLLKLLGEYSSNSPLDAAISVSAPLQLDLCADAMNKGFTKFYQAHLLKSLNLSLEKKFKKHEMHKYIKLKEEEIKSLKTFWEFDEAYTAPIHGFSSAQDYYTRCSSKEFLKNIKTPTLIIHSADDPFMSKEILPKKEELSSSIEFELSAHGGHVGFICGSLIRPEYWLDKRITNYFKSFL